jgi:SAM-dependent methyltransferase
MGSVADVVLVGSPYQAWQKFLQGGLSLGQLLGTDLSTDVRVERQAWQRAAEAHADFWRRWSAWRHAPAGAPGGSFHDILRLFRLEEQLVAYMGVQPHDLVVDLGCGPAWMAQFIEKTIGYLGVDSQVPAMDRINSGQSRAGRAGLMVEGDLMRGLPLGVAEEIGRAVRLRGERVRGLARCSLYFPMPVIRQIVDQLFAVGAYDLTVDHLTAGKFQPLGLMAHFLPFLARGWAGGEFSTEQVRRALRALPTMIKYGIEFKKLFPLWSVAQLTVALAESYRVEVLAQPLWGQTTFLRVRK